MCSAAFLVLARDGVGVVTGHVDRRPPEAGLLLALGDHGVEGGGLEVAEGMKAEVLWELCCLSGLGEGSTDGVGIRRNESPRARRRRRRLHRAGPPQHRLRAAPAPCGAARSCASVVWSMATFRMLVRVFGALITAPPSEGMTASSTVMVAPRQSMSDHRTRTGLPSSDAGRRDHAEADRIAGIELLRLLQEKSYLSRRRSPDRLRGLGQGPGRKLRVLDRVGQLVAAPFSCEPARPIEDGPDVANCFTATPVALELPEEALDLVGGERRDPLSADGLLDVHLPDVLVAADGHRAQVIPSVLFPALDGVVDRRRICPRRGLSGSLGTSGSKSWAARTAAELLFCGALGPAKGTTLVPNTPAAVASEKDAELPGVSTQFGSLAKTACHGPSSLLAGAASDCWDSCWDKRSEDLCQVETQLRNTV